MAGITICSDFGAHENKICYCFHFFGLLSWLTVKSRDCLVLPWIQTRGLPLVPQLLPSWFSDVLSISPFPLGQPPAFLASRPPLLAYPFSRSLIFSSLPPHSLPSAVGARSWETGEQVSAPLWPLTPVPFLSPFPSIFRVSASSYTSPSTTSPPVLRKELGTSPVYFWWLHGMMFWKRLAFSGVNNLDWNPGSVSNMRL